MDEKILIVSERYSCKKLIIIIVLIGMLASLIAFACMVAVSLDYFHDYYPECQMTYAEHQQMGRCTVVKCERCMVIEKYPTNLQHAIGDVLTGGFSVYLYSIVLPISVVGLILVPILVYCWLNRFEMTVTDKRIFGKVGWGKRVDLPVDFVSAISYVRFLKGVSVATSSGEIRFRFIKNADDIYTALNDLLIKRQQQKSVCVFTPDETVVSVPPQADEIEQLKRYKTLLDTGVITQEEFDAKKKQLLGL